MNVSNSKTFLLNLDELETLGLQIFLGVLGLAKILGLRHSLGLTELSDIKFVWLKDKVNLGSNSRESEGPKEGPLHLLSFEA